MNQFKSFAPSFLRIGISLVILWFGSEQLLHPDLWTAFLPSWAKSLPFSQITFIYFNGSLEVVMGLLLIIGLFTRIVSIILALHLLGIVFTLGYNDIAVRDFGLFIALISIFLYGADDYSLDTKLDKKL